MSDHDRGAYTPQTDPPLAFDPRRPSERRPLPMALIGSAVVLVVLLAGVAMVYRGGVREAGQSPRPVGEPVMAVKTAPTGPAAQAPAADATTQPGADVYTPVNQTADAPKLAPAPEQPAARPPPSPATVALLAKPPVPTHVERPAPAADVAASRPVPQPLVRPKVDQSELAAATGGGHTQRLASPQTAPTQVATAQTDAKTSTGSRAATETPTAPSKPVKVASAPSPKTVAATSASSSAASAATPPSAAVVQIGAFSSTGLADKGYADVSAAVPGRMGGKTKHTLALQKDGGTLYRTWVSGFAGRADAVSFCEALKAKGLACFVKGA